MRHPLAAAGDTTVGVEFCEGNFCLVYGRQGAIERLKLTHEGVTIAPTSAQEWAATFAERCRRRYGDPSPGGVGIAITLLRLLGP